LSSVPERLLRRVVGIISAWLALATLCLLAAPIAIASEPPGASLLSQLQGGQRSCNKLSPGDFAQIGRYDMGQIMGSTADYRAMNAQLRASVGAREAELAYRFMGERLGGCATGAGPVAFGTMMGLMGTSEMGASYGSGSPGRGYGSSMMGDGPSGGGGVGAAAIAAIVFGGLVLIALVVWLVVLRAPRRPILPRT
jgi:hypothetical protein